MNVTLNNITKSVPSTPIRDQYRQFTPRQTSVGRESTPIQSASARYPTPTQNGLLVQVMAQQSITSPRDTAVSVNRMSSRVQSMQQTTQQMPSSTTTSPSVPAAQHVPQPSSTSSPNSQQWKVLSPYAIHASFSPNQLIGSLKGQAQASPQRFHSLESNKSTGSLRQENEALRHQVDVLKKELVIAQSPGAGTRSSGDIATFLLSPRDVPTDSIEVQQLKQRAMTVEAQREACQEADRIVQQLLQRVTEVETQRAAEADRVEAVEAEARHLKQSVAEEMACMRREVEISQAEAKLGLAIRNYWCDFEAEIIRKVGKAWQEKNDPTGGLKSAEKVMKLMDLEVFQKDMKALKNSLNTARDDLKADRVMSAEIKVARCQERVDQAVSSLEELKKQHSAVLSELESLRQKMPTPPQEESEENIVQDIVWTASAISRPNHKPAQLQSQARPVASTPVRTIATGKDLNGYYFGTLTRNGPVAAATTVYRQ